MYGAGVYPEGDAAGVDEEAVTGDTTAELDDDTLELDATLELATDTDAVVIGAGL